MMTTQWVTNSKTIDFTLDLLMSDSEIGDMLVAMPTVEPTCVLWIP